MVGYWHFMDRYGRPETYVNSSTEKPPKSLRSLRVHAKKYGVRQLVKRNLDNAIGGRGGLTIVLGSGATAFATFGEFSDMVRLVDEWKRGPAANAEILSVIVEQEAKEP